jgi:hypothetical protein
MLPLGLTLGWESEQKKNKPAAAGISDAMVAGADRPLKNSAISNVGGAR